MYSQLSADDMKKAGDYTLEYAADDVGIWTFDGTQVASVVEADSSWSSDPPSFTTLSNVSTGTHTLVVTVTNSPNSNIWDTNPAGIAWRLKPYIIS